MSLSRRVLSGVVVLIVRAAAAAPPAAPTTQRTPGPVIGFNLWDPKPHAEDVTRIAREVEAMHAAGFSRVVLLPFTYADRTSGRVRQVWPGDAFASMTDAELTAGVARAKALGMTVNVTPFVEPRNRETGRNWLTFTPATVAGRVFWDGYREAVVHFAALAKAAGADEFDVGSELVGMDYERANADEWKKLIDAAADAFGGDVGYTTQHWTFDQPATIDMIWKHPRINVVSISAYLDYQPADGHPGLASPDDARGHASDGPAFVDTVTRNFEAFYTQRLGRVATLVGKPVRVGEFGLPPFDGASTTPWRWDWPAGTPYDALEARNTWAGVLAALGRHPEVKSIDAWVWAWPGGFPGERFGLRPGGAASKPGDPFDVSQSDAVMALLQARVKAAADERR